MHAWDIWAAVGRDVGYDEVLALDGIDEVVTMFVPRQVRLGRIGPLTRSLAMEWAQRGIRVNSISPGYTATPMNLRPEVAQQVTNFEADTPLGRMATVDELVGPAIFLLSEAASFCTGVDLLVDGGFTCW